MARLNLICNGMMLFNEAADHHGVQIIIPDIPGHVRKLCVDPKPAQDKLLPLPIGSYRVSGPAPSNATLRSLIPADRYLVLNAGTVAVNQAAAAATSAILQVPMPPLIRLFRASEPSGSVFGNTPQGAALGVPRIHHDIVVFSYFGLPDATQLSLSSQNGAPLASAVAQGDIQINWILYSTEQLPIAGGSPPHSTDALNNLLTFNGAHTDFSLSAIGLKDGPHSTGIGMSPLHMAAFHELPPTGLGSVIQLDSGDLGCSGLGVG